MKHLWFVYLMAAPAADGLTYFKVGRTKNVYARLGSVQTGCPLRIFKVWSLGMRDCGESQRIEKLMHGLLKPFHSHGEWFRMETDKPNHKQAMADAMKAGMERASLLAPSSWKAMDVSVLRKTVNQERAAMRLEKDKRTVRSGEKNLRIARMALQRKQALTY